MMQYNYLHNTSNGLGDCLSIFNTAMPVWSSSPHYRTLRKYSSCASIDYPQGQGFDLKYLHYMDYGPMHLFNRVRVATGLEPLKEPKAQLDLITYKPQKARVAFSWGAGQWHNEQRRFAHPRAREFYPEHRATFEAFVQKYSDRFEFIEIGTEPLHIPGTQNRTNISLDETIGVLRECEYYMGMHSGLMHLATAIGLRCLITVNFPSEHLLSFATRGWPQLVQEMHWLYPQHQYLHEDSAQGPMQFTHANIERFLNV